MLITWLLAPPLFFLLISLWARLAPEDAMSAIGNSRRKFRSWVWKSAKGRYLRRNKNSHLSQEALLQAARDYADTFTLNAIGEPDDAEQCW
jgi:hypothetical protein